MSRQHDTPILLKDFVLNGLPPDVTLEDLLGIDPVGDRLRLGGAAAARSSRSRTSRRMAVINDYAVDFTLTGDEGGSAPASIAVKIPDGARYVLGSSSLSGRDGSLPDPTLNKGNELRWQLETSR